MAEKKVLKVEEKDKFFHVRFRDPKRYRTCRVPEWASKAAGAVAKGAQATQCKRDGKWETQKVMVPKKPGRTKVDAARLARKIFKRLEE